MHYLNKMNFDSTLSKSLAFVCVLFLTFSSGMGVANADFATLVPCKDSSVFQKRLSNAVKKLDSRKKLYDSKSKEFFALSTQIDSTKLRFERYSNSTLLCGRDGLPHIIATGQWNHSNEFLLPSICFIYIAGWIGWTGRKYVRYVSATENPFANEIIINVPIAISIMCAGFLWPFGAVQELIQGDLFAADEDVTISPR